MDAATQVSGGFGTQSLPCLTLFSVPREVSSVSSEKGLPHILVAPLAYASLLQTDPSLT